MRWDHLPPELESRVRQDGVFTSPVVTHSGSKYRNVETQIGEIKFDSRKEADYYSELLLLQKVGEVVQIELQVPYVLQDGYIWKEMKIRPIVYIADFRVTYRGGTVEVVDTKGFKTSIYKLKKKMLLYRYRDLNFIEN